MAQRFVYVKTAEKAATLVSNSDYSNSIIFVESSGEIWTHGKKFSSMSELSAVDVDGSITAALAKLTYFKTVAGNSGKGDASGPNQTLNIKGNGAISTQVTEDGVVITYTGATTDTVTTVDSEDGSITVSGEGHDYDLHTDASLVKLGAAVSAAATDGALGATDTINEALGKILKKIADVAAAAGAIDVPVTSVAAATNEKAIVVSPEEGDVKVSLKTDNTGNVKFELTTNGLKGAVDLSEYAKTAELPECDIKSVSKGSNGIDVTTTSKDAKVSLVLAETQGQNVTVTQTNGLKVEVDLSNYWNKTEMPKDLVVKSGRLTNDDKTLELTLSNDTTVEIDVENLVDTYTAGDGLDLDDHEFSVKKDSASEAFLSVSENGVKISGVQDAIDALEKKVQAYSVNENTFGVAGSITLDGADLKLTGYTTEGKTGSVAATDTINDAIAKLEGRVDAAAAGGVQRFGGESGEITVKSGSTTAGEVNFAMSGKQLTGTVYGVATAAQGAKADSAVQSVTITEGTYVKVTKTGTTDLNFAINDSAITDLLGWEEL